MHAVSCKPAGQSSHDLLGLDPEHCQQIWPSHECLSPLQSTGCSLSQELSDTPGLETSVKLQRG